LYGIASFHRIWSKRIRKKTLEDGEVHKTCSCEDTNGAWGRLSPFIRSHEAILAGRVKTSIIYGLAPSPVHIWYLVFRHAVEKKGFPLHV